MWISLFQFFFWATAQGEGGHLEVILALCSEASTLGDAWETNSVSGIMLGLVASKIRNLPPVLPL